MNDLVSPFGLSAFDKRSSRHSPQERRRTDVSVLGLSAFAKASAG